MPQLDERKQRILSAIVEMFAATGEPVGSKALAQVFDNAFSSATIRNEMAALTDMGLIQQLHTSSGRVPSRQGYRLYVDRLMPRRRLSREEMARIDELADSIRSRSAERILTDVGAALAELTHCAAVSTTPNLCECIIKQVEVVPISPQVAVLVLVTSASTAKSKMCRTEGPLSQEQLEKFLRLCSEQLVNRTLDEITPAFLQSRSALLGEHQLLPLFAGLYDLVQESSEGRVLLEGQQHLLEYDGNSVGIRRLFDFLARRQELLGLLQQPGPLAVTIGSESQHEELENSSLIVTHYVAGPHLSGALGVIGPMRMDYPKTIAKLEYFSKVLGKLLSDAYD